MADLINTRLFARVERSLRKRLNNINVKPHLMRAALHARNEDEFMAAAARLLINAQERQDWLASWTARRQAEAHDTSPVELDTTPASLDEPLHRTFGITPAQHDRLREALAHELGPIADELLENETQRSDSVGELLDRLESHIGGEMQRARFRDSTVSSGIQPDA